MPQTRRGHRPRESGECADRGGVNKIDLPAANPDRREQLATSAACCPTTGEVTPRSWRLRGAQLGPSDYLLDISAVVADFHELKANPSPTASGTVLEAKLGPGDGPVATLLIQNGTLPIGATSSSAATPTGPRPPDVRRYLWPPHRRSRCPSVPVRITGLDEVPNADELVLPVVPDLAFAREVAEIRKTKLIRNQQETYRALLYLERLGETKIVELKASSFKADFRGSVEAIRKEPRKAPVHEEVRVRVFACRRWSDHRKRRPPVRRSTSPEDTLIVGFNVRPRRSRVSALAEEKGVKINEYDNHLQPERTTCGPPSKAS